MEKFRVDENGFYGEFGGAYIPEELKEGVGELKSRYLEIISSPEFKKEYNELLHHYVGRPSPLYLTRGLSKRHNCKIYLKREDLNHTGAHKINNVIGQVLIARHLGKSRIIAETGAGQHGVATATVCALLGMECCVYMGATDVERQRLNVEKMEMLGAKVVAVTEGNMTLKDATNAAIADWAAHPNETYYVIGSAIGPHPYPDMVARLQSVISYEIGKQLLKQEGRHSPDYVIACVGGGSNAIGATYHFLDDESVKIIIAEAGGKGIESGLTAATIQIGQEGVLHGCRTLIMKSPNGEVAEPYSISAGLDYPGVGPIQAHLARSGRVEVVAIDDDEAMEAALELTRAEGIIPAIESAHALAVLDKRHFEKDDIVVVSLSGRGDKDMAAFIEYVESKN